MNSSFTIATPLLQLISSEQAYHYSIIPIELNDNTLTFKTPNPSNDLKKELKILLGKDINLEFDSKENITQYLSTNFRKSISQKKEDLHFSNDFLEKILFQAKNIGSSDIHFEAYENYCRVRYRLDGKLIEQFVIDASEYPIIINQIKIKGGLDISEKRLPQDGRISIKSKSNEFDIRVSSLPTLYGEKIVLRLLEKDSESIDINELGFTELELKTYKEAIRKPNGIILISGPTGSGKTTTLYATLKLLNDHKTNILTIEDPIEYTLEGVNQVQLKESIGLDFAGTLRTFLRQDPDIIMVGEIRDVKTATMAIRAALTGHLVLSTIHTNSAWGTISRLIDMGIPPYMIASTLNISVAQRLIRKLCPHCKEEHPVSTEMFPDGFKISNDLTTHFIQKGCPKCYYTGYSGRMAIYELIPVKKELFESIKNNENEIDNYLFYNKIMTLKDNAIKLIKEGLTSVEEVFALLSE